MFFLELLLMQIDIPDQTNWAGSWAQIITAIAVVMTSLTGLVVGIRTSRKTAVVHELVNSQNEHQNTRIDQLTAALNAAGLGIPPREDFTPSPARRDNPMPALTLAPDPQPPPHTGD